MCNAIRVALYVLTSPETNCRAFLELDRGVVKTSLDSLARSTNNLIDGSVGATNLGLTHECSADSESHALEQRLDRDTEGSLHNFPGSFS